MIKLEPANWSKFEKKRSKKKRKTPSLEFTPRGNHQITLVNIKKITRTIKIKAKARFGKPPPNPHLIPLWTQATKVRRKSSF